MNKQDVFIQNSIRVHGDKFDYTEVVFKNVDTHVTIICPLHGKFQQTPWRHLNSSYGCRKCGSASSAISKQHDLDYFIAKARSIHGDKYNYDKSIYTSAKDKITITCPSHGDFEQLVSGHLSGYGCKHCASNGKGRVNMELPCTLYYLHIKDVDFYKIGITSLSVDHRYRTAFDREQFDVVFTKLYATGREAYDEEQRLLREYSALKYLGDKVLSAGNTEIFTEDIFKGDYLEYTN